MNTQLLGTLRLTIIDELRAEIREREGVIADLTRDEEPKGALLSPTRPFQSAIGDIVRPVHGDAIAKFREANDAMDKERGRIIKRAMSGKKGKRHRRTPEDIEAMGARLLAYVAKHPAQRGEQIAAALGTDVGTMRKPMLALIAAKKVKTAGQRRGMTYSIRGRK